MMVLTIVKDVRILEKSEFGLRYEKYQSMEQRFQVIRSWLMELTRKCIF